MTMDAQQAVQVQIRWMIRRDMPDVLQIERASFEFAWSEDDFIRCLRQRNCIGMVADVDDRIVGFMIYELHRARLHLLNLAVHPAWRRRGVGAAMVRKLVGKLSQQRRTRITLEVRETNLAAQLFFRQQGFRAVNVLRNFYEDSPEDAYVMQYRYRPTSEEAAEDFQRIRRMAG
jgi:ribosomal-protein-alanine N-acetyltransferase